MISVDKELRVLIQANEVIMTVYQSEMFWDSYPWLTLIFEGFGTTFDSMPLPVLQGHQAILTGIEDGL